MEQIRRRRLEKTQYGMLTTLRQHLDLRSPGTLDDAPLNGLGVVRGQDLDVDNPLPLNVEPRYFAPCHGEISGLEEELAKLGRFWQPSHDGPRPEHLRDDEWVRSAGYTYAQRRLNWFDRVLERLSREYEDEIHPINISCLVNQEDMSLVFTFQSETHARITQAHMDAHTNDIIVRQSRQLELVGAEGQPPADAYLLLRWLLNSPVGVTKYEGDGEGEQGEGDVATGGAETGGVEMPVVVPKSVVVRSG